MRASLDFSKLRQTKWYEYAVRFAFGGAITVFAGLVAKYGGAALGGLFLAFPAIFPASVTLIEKHETKKKRKAGITGSTRGAQAAALDAYGAATGSIGLTCFALIVWKLLPRGNAALVLLFATLVWLGVSMSLWRLRKSRFVHHP